MAKYNVSAVEIENGVITTAFYDKAETITGFLKGKSPVKEVVPVTGWKFRKIYLTHGSQEDGSGWAFHK